MDPNVLKRFFFLFLFPLCLFGRPLYGATVISLNGADIPGGVGTDISRLRLFAIGSKGSMNPIPFQIDEKITKTKGVRDWALKEVSSQQNGPGPDSRLDSDEVVLFLKKDGGGAAAPRSFSGAEKVWEILLDPKGEKRVYLSLGAQPGPNPEKAYLQYHPETDQVTALGYEAGFSLKNPLVQDLLILKNGFLPKNLLDRFKARFKLAFKPFFELKFNEEEIKAKVVGYQTGPIRLRRRVEAVKTLGPIKLIPKSSTDFIFYPDWVEIPTRIKNPVHGPTFLRKETEGLSGFDFRQLILGSRLFTNLNDTPYLLDGREVGGGVRVTDPDFRWWSVTGLAGSLMVAVQNDSQLQRLGIYPQMVLFQDMTKSFAPESQQGGVFVGFDLPYHKIPKGTYTVKVLQVFPQRFLHGKEEIYLQEARLEGAAKINLLK